MEFIQKYFNAERAESIVFFSIGIVAISTAIWFFFFKNNELLRGAAYPIALISLIQLGVGASIFFRTPKDIARVEQFVQNEPARVQTDEVPRMEKVMRSFVIIRWVEIGLLAAGLGLWLFAGSNQVWKGVGLGLAMQALIMLGADYFAEARGHVYLKDLKNWITQ